MVFVFPEREVVAGANTFEFVPRGCIHTARITQSMRGLLIISPAMPSTSHSLYTLST